MRFKTKTDPLLTALSGGIVLLLIYVLISVIINQPIVEALFPIIMLILVLVVLIWAGFGTYYKLTDKKLFYRSGPFYGAIELTKITEIIKGKTMWSGLKPATARKGLIIKYEKYNEIYISPHTNDSFIKAILKLNPDIKIKSEKNSMD